MTKILFQLCLFLLFCFLIDAFFLDQGYWSGDTNFLPQKAIYSMNFIKFERTLSQYYDIMSGIEMQLKAVDQEAYHNAAAINLMYWMQWRFHSNDSTYLFQMAATPVVVFSRAHVLFTLGTSSGACDVYPVRTFIDNANSVMGTEYYITDFASSPQCVQTISPTSLGYMKALDGMYTSFSLNINTVTLCIALNMRLIFPDDLLFLGSNDLIYSNNGVSRVYEVIAKAIFVYGFSYFYYSHLFSFWCG